MTVRPLAVRLLAVRLSAAALLAMTSAAPAAAQAPADEAQVKAAFVYNFLRFVDWPSAALPRAGEPIVIAIVGDGTTADAAARFLAEREIEGHKLVVHRVRWDQSLAGVHAVFVTEADAGRVRRVLGAVAGAAVLTIGDGEEFAGRGGMITLLVEERRVRFDIDTGAADSVALRISSKLLTLARRVRPRPIAREAPR